jgi:hypothetical protein
MHEGVPTIRYQISLPLASEYLGIPQDPDEMKEKLTDTQMEF